jgi:hypothetical protein
MGKWKAIIEAGKGYSKRTAKQGSESLTQGTKDINDLYKPFDKTNEVKKEPNLQDSMKKAISNISDEYRSNDEALKKISKYVPEDTTKLRTDVSWQNQSSVKKLEKQLKDFSNAKPQDSLKILLRKNNSQELPKHWESLWKD